MDDIKTRLAQSGRKQSELARHLGMDPSLLSRMLKGRRHLRADEMTKIEGFFETGPEYDPGLRPNGRPAQFGRVPVYGYAAAGGEDRIAFNEGRAIDWIEGPPLWRGSGELIAVRVIGSSMEPRLFQGEMVVAQARLQPARGQDCIVEFSDGSGLVKTFCSIKDGFFLCRQWNPDKEVRVAVASVKALHAVIWRR